MEEFEKVVKGITLLHQTRPNTKPTPWNLIISKVYYIFKK